MAADDFSTAGGQPELAALLARLDAQMAQMAEMGEGSSAPPTAGMAGDGEPAPRLAGRYVVFSLGESDYALPLASVVEISQALVTTRVPHLPAWVSGVVNLRGDILAVLDLAGYLEIPAAALPQDGRLLIVRNRSDEIAAGLSVDAVHGITTLAEIRLTSGAAGELPGKVAPHLAGVAERDGKLVSLLDLDSIFEAPDLRRLRES